MNDAALDGESTNEKSTTVKISRGEPVPFTPYNNDRLIIATDMSAPYNTIVAVLFEGQWQPVGLIQSFSFFADLHGTLKAQATVAALPPDADPTSDVVIRLAQGIEKSTKLLRAAGVEVI